jgi:Protein of unknown function (DUF5132)
MALLYNVLKGGNLVTGVAIAVGATVLAPLIVPAIGGVLRPAAKAIIKGGIVTYQYGRQAVAHMGDMVEDAAAEVRAEADRAKQPVTGSATESKSAYRAFGPRMATGQRWAPLILTGFGFFHTSRHNL